MEDYKSGAPGNALKRIAASLIAVFTGVFPAGFTAGFIPAIIRHARWLPFAALLGWGALLGFAGALAYDLRLVLLAGCLGACWLFARRLWPLALLALLAVSPLAWQLGWVLPRQGEEIGALAPGQFVRIHGTVRQQAQITLEGRRMLRLLLGEVRITGGESRWELLEVEVLLPQRRASSRRWFRRSLRIGGRLERAVFAGSRLSLRFEKARYHAASIPIEPWRSEGLRAALQDRAGYYLSRPANAVYLPIILGVRERATLEARSVVESFRRVGISHLFAISGLHIGLLFGLLLFVSHHAVKPLLRGQGWLHTQAALRGAIVLIVWGYIALIGFPVPAVRAAIMATMLVWSDLWGTRTPRLYVLCMAGLMLAVVTPTIIYDVSFQLSFLSFFCLLMGLNLIPGADRDRTQVGRPTPWQRLRQAAALNLAITLAITLGIWPVLAMHFGQISLLVFLGNLLMIPILSLLVLPSGLAAMLLSWTQLGQVPGGWSERVVFGWLEWVLGVWLWLVRLIERGGDALIFPVRLAWRPQHVFWYYALLGGGLLLIGLWRSKRNKK